MSYQVALTQVAFNRNYENVMRFDNRAQQEQFFRVDELFNNAQDVNLLKGNFFNLEIPWKVSGNSLKEMESYNYCIIRETLSSNTYKYYYYFITNLRYDQSNQFLLSLELDVMNTYYIDAVFSDGLINRAHLKRWKWWYVDGQIVGVEFNNDPDSLMLIPDNTTSLSKYCIERDKLFFPIRGVTDEVNLWLKENIAGWEYIFLRKDGPHNSKYKVYDRSGNASEVSLTQPYYVNGSNEANEVNTEAFFTYLCRPIYQSGNYMYTETPEHTIIIGNTGNTHYSEDGFSALNDGTTYYISKVVSKQPPIDFVSDSSKYEIVNNNLHIKDTNSNWICGSNEVMCAITSKANDPYNWYGLILANSNLVTRDSEYYELPTQTKFYFDEIIGADFNKKFNPKLLSSDYINLTIRNDAGQGYEYDIQKINQDKIRVAYTERVTAGVTRSYARLDSALDNYGIYQYPTFENLTGLVSSQDSNITYYTDKLDEFLANNRNAQTQLTARGIQGLSKSLINFLVSTAMGGLIKGGKGAETGAMGGIGGIANSLIDWGFSQINFNLTKDNMKQAPDMIESANGEIMFNMSYTDLGIYVEIYKGLDAEIDREAERMNLFGFKYNRLGNVKNFDNIRKYFNFVQGVIETAMYNDNNVLKPMPNIVLSKFRDIFNKGVRFWNYAGGKFIDYAKENYELYLDGVNE